eukprot:jgi/Galph1/1329/GphlegSOOS_G6009.1
MSPKWNPWSIQRKASRWFWLLPRVTNLSVFQSEVALGGFILFQTTILMVTTYFELGFSFMPFWNLAFALIVGLMGIMEDVSWLLRCCFLVIPCGIMSFPSSLIGLSAFMPIMGRSGPWLLTDVIIGAMTSSFFILICLPIFVFLAKHRPALRVFQTVSLIVFIFGLLLIFHMEHPYNGDTAPKRVIIQHLMASDSNMTLYSKGLFVSGIDVRDLKSEKLIKELSWHKMSLASSFSWGLLNSSPWENLQPLSWFFSGYQISDDVALHDLPSPQLKVLRRSKQENDLGRTVELFMSFPKGHWGSIRMNASLSSWSLSNPVPKAFSDGTRFLRHIGGYGETTLLLILNTSDNEPFAIDMTSTYFGPSPVELDFIQLLPDWIDTVSFYTHCASFLIE